MKFDPYAPELDALVEYLRFRANLEPQPYQPEHWDEGVLVVIAVDDHSLNYPAYSGEGTRTLPIWNRRTMLRLDPPGKHFGPRTSAQVYGSLRAYTGTFGRGRLSRKMVFTDPIIAGDPYEAFRLAADKWFELALRAYEEDGYSRDRILKNIGRRGKLPFGTASGHPDTTKTSPATPISEQLELLG